ncbi:PhzF family phenazine biosynthesis protein [Pseudomonas aeruginosa]|nr:PhzF family phenazine biosynthesis protein [Pseudomonas aeruginosa]
MNLSESTFFIRPQQDGDAPIRIFTPVNELPFARPPATGHRHRPGRRDRQGTGCSWRPGWAPVPFALERQDGKVVACSMQRSQSPPRSTSADRPSCSPPSARRARPFPSRSTRNGPRHVFVGLESVAALSTLHPDHRALCGIRTWR